MKKLPRMSHERAVHVFGFLADYGELYPRLLEGDRAMYRDLARAALACLADEHMCDQMALAPDIDRVIAPLVRAQILAERLRRRQKSNNAPVGQPVPAHS